MKRSTMSVSAMLIVVLLAVVGLAVAIPGAAAQCGGTIRAGQTVVGSIARAGSSCSYTFSGAAGEAVTIKLVATGPSLDPFLTLSDPGGRVVATDDDSAGGGNSLVSYRMAQAGTYTIIAGAYNNATAGDFSLRLDSSSGGAACGSPITANTWVPGSITGRGQRCQYTFNGRRGEVVSVKMRTTAANLDPWLDLVDPRGTIVAYDDDSLGGSNSLIKGYQLLQSGQYTIVARAYNDQGSGPFEVLLER